MPKIYKQPIGYIKAEGAGPDIIEAALFISGRFLTMQEMISLSDLNPIIIRNLFIHQVFLPRKIM